MDTTHVHISGSPGQGKSGGKKEGRCAMKGQMKRMGLPGEGRS
jgi:hypothetical protein